MTASKHAESPASSKTNDFRRSQPIKIMKMYTRTAIAQRRWLPSVVKGGVSQDDAALNRFRHNPNKMLRARPSPAAARMPYAEAIVRRGRQRDRRHAATGSSTER